MTSSGPDDLALILRESLALLTQAQASGAQTPLTQLKDGRGETLLSKLQKASSAVLTDPGSSFGQGYQQAGAGGAPTPTPPGGAEPPSAPSPTARPPPSPRTPEQPSAATAAADHSKASNRKSAMTLSLPTSAPEAPNPTVLAKMGEYVALLDILNKDHGFLLGTLCETTGAGAGADDLAQALTKVLSLPQALALVKHLIAAEVALTESEKTMFRRNSMTTKFISAFSAAYGDSIVEATLKARILEITMNRMALEIDPSRLKDTSQADVNKERLSSIAQGFIDSIMAIGQAFPAPLRLVAKHIAAAIKKKFSGCSSATAVGAFVFLRLFCPAVIDPSVAGVDDVPVECRRTLTLVAKMLQNLANGAYFKEPYMQSLNSFIDKNTPPMTAFFDELVHIEEGALVAAASEPPLEQHTASLLVLHSQTTSMLPRFRNWISTHPPAYASVAAALDDFTTMESRLARLGSAPAKIEPSVLISNMTPVSKRSPDELAEDKKFRKKFSLPADELILHELSCALERKLPVHGRMVVSQSTFCFSARVFGFKTTETIYLKDVVSFEKDTSHAAGIELTMVSGSVLQFSGIAKFDYQFKVLKSHWNALRKTMQAEAASGGASAAQAHAATAAAAQERQAAQEKLARQKEEARATGALTETDWRLFLEGAKSLTFAKDMTILAEGEKAHSLYQIARGAVRIEKVINGKLTVLRQMKAGEMFGEISFLEGNTASASVIADTDAVDIYQCEGSFVEGLMQTHPDFSGRFYKFLAINLARRLMTPRPGPSPSSKTDAQRPPASASPTTAATPSTSGGAPETHTPTPAPDVSPRQGGNMGGGGGVPGDGRGPAIKMGADRPSIVGSQRSVSPPPAGRMARQSVVPVDDKDGSRRLDVGEPGSGAGNPGVGLKTSRSSGSLSKDQAYADGGGAQPGDAPAQQQFQSTGERKVVDKKKSIFGSKKKPAADKTERAKGEASKSGLGI